MQERTEYTVQIVDDHHMMRMGLIAFAQTTDRVKIAWRESKNFGDALECYRLNPKIDLVLLDLNLPDSQGLQGVQRFLCEFPAARVAVFSGTEDEFVIRQALTLGAVGFIPKSSSAESTLRLIETHLTGAAVPVNSHITAGHLANKWNNLITNSPVSLTEKLSSTQLKVLELVLSGMSNQEIATASQLALGTVKNTVSSILLTLDVRSRSHLISMFR